jgi:hypothetical protein
MVSLRLVVGLSLLAAAGCDGPTLHVGSYVLELDASEASDARMNEDEDLDDDDEEEDAGRVRDAQQNDAGDARYPFGAERRWCSNAGQCSDNVRNRLCSPELDQCVECLRTEDCYPFGSSRCNEMIGICREPDRTPRP